MARVVVEVMPKPEILDPQGKAVTSSLERLGFTGLQVRQGKRFEVEVDGEIDDAVIDRVHQAAELLLANTVIENYEVHVEKQAVDEKAQNETGTTPASSSSHQPGSDRPSSDEAGSDKPGSDATSRTGAGR